MDKLQKLSSMHTQEEKRKKENKNMKLYQVSPEKKYPNHPSLVYSLKKTI